MPPAIRSPAIRTELAVIAAWNAAVIETAGVYRIDSKVLGQVRQAGPRVRREGRTPPAYWEARKVATYVAVLAADCTYAALARVMGLHRDTVTCVCEEIRNAAIEDAMFWRRIEQLEIRARARVLPELRRLLDAVDQAMVRMYALQGEEEPPEEVERRRALKLRVADASLNAGANPTAIRTASPYHENIIGFPGKAE
jgi:hypothetical protein